MRGLTYGIYHTYRAWGLFLAGYEITPPVVREKYVEIAGRDGLLDLSEALTGAPVYDNRTITANYVLMAPRAEWENVYSGILNAMHGKRLDIVLDDDPNYYYTGRAKLTEWKRSDTTVNITITATVDPFKHERYGDGVIL